MLPITGPAIHALLDEFVEWLLSVEEEAGADEVEVEEVLIDTSSAYVAFNPKLAEPVEFNR